MSLFKLGGLTATGSGPAQPAESYTPPPSARPAEDRTQKPAAVQHSSVTTSSASEQNRTAEIAEADELLAALDGTRSRMRPVAPLVERPVTGQPTAPSDTTAIVPVPAGCYIAGTSDSGKPIIRDKATGQLQKGSGAPPGAGKGRAPGLAKMVRDIVHIPGIITFLQDVAVGKLAAGTKMADRIKAAEILLDRGYGKPTQHVELKDETASSEARKQVEAMTTQQLAATVDKLRALVALKPEHVTDAELVE